MDWPFVILEHQTPRDIHWDLMIQQGQTLWTWRMPAECLPIEKPVALERIEDHPLRFLTYQGAVQNHTGAVRQVEKGIAAVHRQTDGQIDLTFQSSKLNGAFALRRIDQNRWQISPRGDTPTD